MEDNVNVYLQEVGCGGMGWTQFPQDNVLSVVGSCEQNDESLVSTNGRECLDQLSDYQLIKKAFSVWSSLM
jgi:hypothetical protein